MHRGRQLPFVACVLIVLSLAACSPASGGAGVAPTQPAVVVEEGVDGAADKLTLSPRAASRLDVQTATVSATSVAGVPRLIIPFAAVVYEADGTTWAYQNVDGLTFVRQSITVDRIDGELAVLFAGPPAGALVVTVGAAELLGVEHGVGGGH